MSNEMWDHNMGPARHWKDAYLFVANRARDALDKLPAGKTIGTADLVAHLYRGDNEFTRQRIFKALKAMAAHQLVAYWTAGPEEHWMGRVRRPKQWHRAITAAKTCPKCGAAL